MPYKDPEKRREALAKGSKNYYAKNKATVIARTKAAKVQNKARWEEYKKTLACAICGFKHPAAIDFHHVDPDAKEHNIFRLISCGQFTKAYRELDKCVPLCANCHRVHHYNERKLHKAKHAHRKKRPAKGPISKKTPGP